MERFFHSIYACVKNNNTDWSEKLMIFFKKSILTIVLELSIPFIRNTRSGERMQRRQRINKKLKSSSKLLERKIIIIIIKNVYREREGRERKKRVLPRISLVCNGERRKRRK